MYLSTKALKDKYDVAKVQKKTAGSLFAKDISANIGMVMLQGCLVTVDLGAAGILQAPSI